MLAPNCQAGQAVTPAWSYQEAFARNRGLISPEEQQRLRTSRVAIVGMGGVGGVHLVTLARLGIGRFTIADPDSFEVANFNRQYGATVATVGRSKAEVMAEVARSINPDVELTVFNGPITPDNAGDFLQGADVFLDGLDFFNIQMRRLLFAQARARGMWALTVGPIGFTAAWLLFDPQGMTFDRYFDLNDRMDRLDQLVAYAVGLTPRATHLGYFDLKQVDLSSGADPSAGLACQLASGVAAAETLKMLLRRGGLHSAPCFGQFDAYRNIMRHGKVRWGNRHPVQRLKRLILRRRMIHLGYGP